MQVILASTLSFSVGGYPCSWTAIALASQLWNRRDPSCRQFPLRHADLRLGRRRRSSHLRRFESVSHLAGGRDGIDLVEIRGQNTQTASRGVYKVKREATWGAAAVVALAAAVGISTQST